MWNNTYLLYVINYVYLYNNDNSFHLCSQKKSSIHFYQTKKRSPLLLIVIFFPVPPSCCPSEEHRQESKFSALRGSSSSPLAQMGCGKLFFMLVVTLSTALITYNIIISAKASLKQDFPGPSSTKSHSSFSQDPIIKMPTDLSSSSSAAKKTKRLFHTAVTASDSVYNTWQCRLMYYWFKKQKNKPNSEMGGFTRILHSGKPDKFVDEIPTFVAQPLPSGMDQVSFSVFIFSGVVHRGVCFKSVKRWTLKQNRFFILIQYLQGQFFRLV